MLLVQVIALTYQGPVVEVGLVTVRHLLDEAGSTTTRPVMEQRSKYRVETDIRRSKDKCSLTTILKRCVIGRRTRLMTKIRIKTHAICAFHITYLEFSLKRGPATDCEFFVAVEVKCLIAAGIWG